jgi:hypothetical protein
MAPDIENHVDWVAAASPNGEQVGPGLTRMKLNRVQPEQRFQAPAPAPRIEDSQRVMEKLLGSNSLAAHDERGADPYNATGRQFRR